MSAVLGVDVGSVRIGVAICESPELPAVPLATLAHASREDDVRRLVALARERGARTIVVGYPIRLDGTRGPEAVKIDRFIADLQRAFEGQVTRADERLSTAAAAKRLRETGLSGGKRRRLVDRLAAAEILESYVSARRRRG